eukprot:1593224-Amphidinium_carterae.1
MEFPAEPSLEQYSFARPSSSAPCECGGLWREQSQPPACRFDGELPCWVACREHFADASLNLKVEPSGKMTHLPKFRSKESSSANNLKATSHCCSMSTCCTSTVPSSKNGIKRNLQLTGMGIRRQQNLTQGSSARTKKMLDAGSP